MEVVVSDEQKSVFNFRKEQLLNAGWSRRAAEKIAADETVDWHLAVRVRIGCEDEKLLLKVLL